MMLSLSIIHALGEIVGADNVFADKQSLADFCCDKSTQFKAHIGALVYPQTTEQVQAIVLLANQENIAIVPSGGRTGLSGGALATQGELIVSMDKMNKILSFNAFDQLLECQAGVITQVIQDYAKQHGLLYPVDFASKGSSQIGGNISTNAGGINVIRYGMTRQWVKGLTVVTGKGDILKLNQGLEKNNTGFDLMQLFIGAEGSLGFITEATIKLARADKPLAVALLAVENFAHLTQLLSLFRQNIELNAFEFFAATALHYVLLDAPQLKPNIQTTAYYALIEFEQTAIEAVQQLAEQSLHQGLIDDAIFSQNLTQAKNLWRLREDISSCLAKFQPYKNDLCVKVSDLANFLADVERFIGESYPDFEVVCYGHIGDGNLHLNILKPSFMQPAQFSNYCHQASKTIMAIVEKYHGSISAEHGVGLLKKDYLSFSKSFDEIAYMTAIKAVFDPNNIINPGKIFE